MPSLLTKPVKFLLTTALFLMLSPYLRAQNQDPYFPVTFRIDSLINVGLPKSALALVDRLDQLARNNHDDAQQINAVIYRITLQSYTKEDALQDIVGEIKNQIRQASYPVKPVLQSLLAKIYLDCHQQERFSFAGRSRLDKPDPDFTKWDLQTLNIEISHLYQLSLTDAAKEQTMPISAFSSILDGNHHDRYLRPTLYDLLVQNALDFYLGRESELTHNRETLVLKDPALYADNQTFIAMKLPTTDTSSYRYHGLKLLQQATAFHVAAGNIDASAELELQRLDFLRNCYQGPNNDTLYVHGVKRIFAQLQNRPFGSEPLSSLSSYYQQKDDLVTALYYADAAIKLFPGNNGGRNGKIIRQQILSRNLQATVENINAPGKPVLGIISYRNLKTADVEVYRITPEMIRLLILKRQGNEQGPADFNPKLAAILSKFTPAQTKRLHLTGTEDYKDHSAEFGLDSMTAGNYLMLVKTGDIKDHLTQITNFCVSRLSYAVRLDPDNKKEIRVLDRETGAPLAGVKVAIYRHRDGERDKSKKAIAKGITDHDGKCIFNVDWEFWEVELSTPGDTFTSAGPSYLTGYLSSQKTNVKPQQGTVLFTDRQIYRPGQTVYFKAIQVLTIDGKSNVVPHTALNVNLLDANHKTIQTLALQTNDFGSVSGSFVIPQNALGGRMEIYTAYGEVAIQVAEYKRPTYNISFLPVTETYHPGDSIHLKGKVIAFSGYGLSRAKVAYRVNPAMRPITQDHMSPEDRLSLITDTPDNLQDTITTNNEGEFTLSFKAFKPEKNFPHAIYDLNITADITAASGETHSAETTVPVSDDVLQIAVELPENLAITNHTPVPVRINNLLNQFLAGTVNVAVYQVAQPGQAFKERRWEKPDQFIIARGEFKKNFPTFSYRNEDDPDSWTNLKTISNNNLDIPSAGSAAINLDELSKQSPGIYRVVIKAKSSLGDTTSITRYINLIGDTPKAQNINNWMVPVVTTVNKGQKALFYVGNGLKGDVLFEEYDDTKIIAQQWLHINGPNQQIVEIPVPVTPKNSISVQFLMVSDNRQYHSYQKLTVRDTLPSIKMRLATYRDKMQPGDKEQWKIVLADNQKGMPNAEVLAAMYDASLDDITSSQGWAYQFNTPYENSPYYTWQTIDFTIKSETAGKNYDDSDPSIDLGGDPPSALPQTHESIRLSNIVSEAAYEMYLYNVQVNRSGAKRNALLAAQYAINAKMVKQGFDIIGQTESEGNIEPGVSISVKNTSIKTKSNSLGYFRIRVPANAVVIFKGGKPRVTKELHVSHAGYYRVVLKPNRNYYMEVLDGAPKSQKGDPTQEIRIDEPVGNSDVKGAVEDNEMYSSPAPATSMVRFPPPVVKDDQEILLKNLGNTNELKVADPGYRNRRRPIAIRKNFSETAFFYPQLNTNEKGEIEITFTAPEALTQWKFRAFAHTQNLQTDYLEQTTVTQKELSIDANMPRFFREGDTITVSARLANISDEVKQGIVKMRFFNALNMQPVQLFAYKSDAEQPFNVAAKSNKPVSFHLVIPAGLDAVTYQLTAEAGLLSDGEEKTLPVLPNRELVTESMPLMVRAGESKSFTFDKLVNQKSTTLKNKTFTLEYTQNPAWYAVQAMPYLMEFPYECAEQTFSRYFANSLATNLINKMPVIQQVFRQWKNANSTMLLSNLERNPELKATLLEETPWLKDAENETEQKNRMALLFDLSRMGNELKLNLDKLQKLQMGNGGFVWFGGDRADRYITQHILAGIGQLYHLNIDLNNATLKMMSRRAIHYMDGQLLNDDKDAKKLKNYETRAIDPTEAHAWYARSFFPNAPMSADLKKVQTNYLDRAESQRLTQGVYQQGMIALTMLRYGKADVARKIIKSLLETAQQSDELGMYWRKNQLGYYWYESPVETQSLLISLFTEAGGQEKTISEMKIWLLRSKQTNSWQTTKATSAAIYALLMKNEDWLSSSNTSIINVNGKPLTELKPDTKADAGSGYTKTVWTDEQVKPALGNISISNKGTSVSFGAAHWQYLEQLDKITPASTYIRLRRNYFIVKPGTSGDTFILVDSNHQPKTGDLLKVIVYLDADLDFEYVQLKDLRPAGTEPVSTLSEWKYQDRLFYYQVTKDVATNFFINRLSKGSYVFEYQLRVAQPGHFSTGVATVQCIYAPEFSAHSQGGRIGFVE